MKSLAELHESRDTCHFFNIFVTLNLHISESRVHVVEELPGDMITCHMGQS